MDRLISEKEAIEAINDYWGEMETPTIDGYINAIKAIPTAEQKIGHWIPKYIAEHPKEFICDQCGYFVNIKYANLPFIDSPYEEYKFCSNCGVRMEVEQNG